RTLSPLSYYPNGDTTQAPVTNATYDQYESALTGPSQHFNGYKKEEGTADLRLERSFLGGKVRLLGGYEFAFVNMTAFDGNSLLQNDARGGVVSGLGYNNMAMLQFGAVYDTRDLETDPNRGLFAEITEEVSHGVVGSAFNFNKTVLHVK